MLPLAIDGMKEGFLIPFVVYAYITLLHLILPARWVDGYVTDESGKPMRYRLNGLPVLLIVLGTWYALGHFNILPLGYIALHWVPSLIGAFILGMIFSWWVVRKELPVTDSYGKDFFLGRAENPQWLGGRIDAKMWLYLVGAVMLALNAASVLAQRYVEVGQLETGYILYAAMFGWFIVDYLFFERVHLWTYDFFAERVGFKLGWGCLTFYPYFYGFAGLWLVGQDLVQQSTWEYFFYSGIFLTGWCLARGANMQKWTFKVAPEKAFLGFLKPEVVTDGKRKLLVNGWWGASRHINYLGEILMATGIALTLGWWNWVCWLYPLYYILLLFPRQHDDDKRCAKKYGPLWDKYVTKVRWRIIPGIY